MTGRAGKKRDSEDSPVRQKKILRPTDDTRDTEQEDFSDDANANVDEDAHTKNVLDDEIYCLLAAFLTSKRSEDPVTQVGACIVDKNNKIVSTGYNCMPRGSKDDAMSWEKGEKKYYVCHAEMNALVNKNAADVNDCKMYCTLFPCCECTKLIIHSGIQEVIFSSNKLSDKNKTIASEIILQKAEISTRKTENGKKYKLDLDENLVSQIMDQSTSTSGNNGHKIISWEEYFMFMALLSARRSNIENKVGACVVNELMQIVGIGFSCFPKYFKEETIPSYWKYGKRNFFFCHATINAILNKNTPSLKGCTLYVTEFPCYECAKVIVQYGISNIIFYKDPKLKEHYEAKRIFDSLEEKVTYSKYSSTKSLTIDLNDIN